MLSVQLSFAWGIGMLLASRRMRSPCTVGTGICVRVGVRHRILFPNEGKAYLYKTLMIHHSLCSSEKAPDGKSPFDGATFLRGEHHDLDFRIAVHSALELIHVAGEVLQR